MLVYLTQPHFSTFNQQVHHIPPYVVSEMIKQRFNAGHSADLYFWRDNVGNEIDVLYETPQGLQAVEIKSGSTFVSDWTHASQKWQKFAGEEALTPIIIYGGESNYDRENCHVAGWRKIKDMTPSSY